MAFKMFYLHLLPPGYDMNGKYKQTKLNIQPQRHKIYNLFIIH